MHHSPFNEYDGIVAVKKKKNPQIERIKTSVSFCNLDKSCVCFSESFIFGSPIMEILLVQKEMFKDSSFIHLLVVPLYLTDTGSVYWAWAPPFEGIVVSM